MNPLEKSIFQKEYLKNHNYLERLIKFIFGCFIVSVSYNLFLTPNNLVPGGVGGIATILNRLFGFRNSTVIMVLNSFLLIVSFFLLGKEKTKSTIIGSILFPTFVKLTENINVWIQFDTSQILLSSICGGIIYGIGIGLIFKAGFTTGGTDIINHVINKYAKTGIGKSMLVVDGSIVLTSGLFFGINSMMYSILILYIISIISDRVILGISDSKAFFIITHKEKVKEYIINDLKHGITEFDSLGGHDNKKQKVLMTVLPTKEYYKVKEGINKIDSETFYIITDTYEVFGGK